LRIAQAESADWGAELADALIAATAIVYSEKLLSGNTKHYKHIPNIQLEKFTP